MRFIFILSFICIEAGYVHAQSAELSLWIRYPSISPDGSTIAFSYQGDIYTVPTDGGTAMPITLSGAYDYLPLWSPDGKTIAFASDRNGNMDVFVVPAEGGNATRLTYHSAGDMPSGFTADGTQVIFTSSRLDDYRSAQSSTGALPELYAVPVKGGTERQLLTTPALWARYNSKGDKLVYQDQKGYEDELRKHHTSSVTRDIWLYDVAAKSFTQLTTYNGEDLNPVWGAGDQYIYYTSEQDGTANIWRMDVQGRGAQQITRHRDHPVRHLSCSSSGLLCYSWHGTVYTVREGTESKAVQIKIATDNRYNPEVNHTVRGVSEVAISPNGKELAFVSRGEVFVASTAEGTTRRITNTPEQERQVDFSPDGRSLVYASERNGSWNLYKATIGRKEEEYFFLSTLINEEPLLVTAAETFQPRFSPDGKEVAFLENRTALKVLNIESKAVREILPSSLNYSYEDGDQFFDWSPDGKWLLVNYLPGKQWIGQVGLVAADGKGQVKNLSESGYGAYAPTWMMEGKMYIYYSARDGMKNHASWGGQMDVYAQFLSQQAWDEFNMNEEEYTIYSEAKKKKEEEEKKKKDEEDAKKKDSKAKAGDKADKDKKDELKPVVIDWSNMDDRRKKLTIHSSDLGGAYVSPDGAKLYYLSKFEKGYDLWQTNLRTRETKIVAKVGQGGGGLVADKEGKFLYLVSDGNITRVDVEKGETKPVPVRGEMVLNENAERAYLFEHIWRQVREKFYVTDLHKVRWDFYKAEYARVLSSVNNNYDFAEMMSEMLGELNASHTGAFFGNFNPQGDQTASLGLYYDNNYNGTGMRITEVMAKSPVLKNGTRIKPGVVIEKIDGTAISPENSFYRLLNRKAGTNTLLSLLDPATGQRWDETVKPISLGQESELRYKRWVENCRHLVDSLSGGRVGYVHVRGMDDRSFRTVYDEALGRNAFKDALIVDTRYNGGGWLHDDLATFLSGKPYITFFPRGQDLGNEPQFKWSKPSCVVMNEFNYSDAHMFPFAYHELGIGKLVGMPVAGTGTAVWWEGLQNGVVFGIPQVGMVDKRGNYLENQELQPDVRVANEPAQLARGRDQQLEAAVKVLLAK